MTVRHLATSYNGDRIAVAEFEHHVAIWDLEKGEKVCDFQSILDFGGRRLAISKDGTLCAAGAYPKYGVAVYNASIGKLIWQRRDLTKVQFLRFGYHRKVLFACIDEQSCHILNATNGQTLTILQGVESVAESPFQQLALFGTKKEFHLYDFPKNHVIATIPRTTFAGLDSAFTEDTVVVSESGGPVSSYRVPGGKLLWRYTPDQGNHVIRLTHCEELQEVVGLSLPYKYNTSEALLFFNKQTGDTSRRVAIEGRPEIEFAQKGSLAISSHGDVISTITQKIVRHLAF